MDTLDPPGDENRRNQPREPEVAEYGTTATPEATPVAGATPLPRSEPAFTPWNYRPDAGWTPEFDIVGYHIEATDGSIGKITEASHASNDSYVIVDTGPWIFGKKVIIPAGTVTHIDHTDRKVYVDRTKDQVKASPEYGDDLNAEPGYRDKIGDYYHDTYRIDPRLGGNLML